MSLHSDDTLTLNGGKLIEIVQDTSFIDSEGIKQVAKNVYHFYRVTAFAYSAPDIVAAFNDAFVPTYENALNNSCTITQTTVRDLSNPTDAGAALLTLTTGDQLGDRLPSSQAVVVNLKTGLRGKNFRGSKHYVGCSETMTTKDELNGSGTVAWVAVGTTLATVPMFLDAANNQWLTCVLSTSLSKLTNTPVVVTYADVTSSTLNLTLGTMRRRKERTRLAP
jgi:hypothetical protein